MSYSNNKFGGFQNDRSGVNMIRNSAQNDMRNVRILDFQGLY